MKPVFQTKMGDPGGNCFQACVASVLEVPLSEVPDFMNDTPAEEEWTTAFSAWVESCGFHAFLLAGDDVRPMLRDGAFGGAPVIVCGDHPKGKHACVYVNGELAHDPNPKHSRCPECEWSMVCAADCATQWNAEDAAGRIGHGILKIDLVIVLWAPPVLTDAHRLSVVREIWGEMKHGGGNPHADLCRYEDNIKERVKGASYGAV
jgi:hypothetical protein